MQGKRIKRNEKTKLNCTLRELVLVCTKYGKYWILKLILTSYGCSVVSLPVIIICF